MRAFIPWMMQMLCMLALGIMSTATENPDPYVAGVLVVVAVIWARDE